MVINMNNMDELNDDQLLNIIMAPEDFGEMNNVIHDTAPAIEVGLIDNLDYRDTKNYSMTMRSTVYFWCTSCGHIRDCELLFVMKLYS